MKIDRNNYPEFFLDFFEGRLSLEAEAGLFAFLEHHPDLKAEFDRFQLVVLPSDDNTFPDKDALKRGEINADNADWHLAAMLEGDLSHKEQKNLKAFLASDPDKKKSWDLMQKVRLHPDDSVVFPNKSGLKRFSIETPPVSFVRRRLWHMVSAAAILLFIASLFFLRIPIDQGADYAIHTDTTPAAGAADVPKAVADVRQAGQEDITSEPRAPSSELSDASQAQAAGTRPAAGDSNRPATRPSSTADRSATQKAEDYPSAHPMVAYRQDVPADTPAGTRNPAPLSPVSSSMQAGINVTQQAEMDFRTEFAYWTPANLQRSEELALMDQGASSGSVTQAVLTNMIEAARTPDSDQVSSNRLFNVASAGLTTLGRFAANALGIERERDESGRLRQLAIGDKIEVRRGSANPPGELSR